MILKTPHFYPQFQCLAAKCSDTCCVGWEIDVDEKSQAKYCALKKKSAGKERRQKFVERLLQQIEDGHFKLLPGDRCPFLKADGLCEMICELGCNGTDIGEDGESVLCDICREHPRFVEVYGDIMEKGIGLCCEEGVRLLLENAQRHPEQIAPCHPEQSSPCHPRLDRGSSYPEQCEGSTSILPLTESEIDEPPDEMPEGALEARNAIFAEREQIFKILDDRSRPLNQRLIEVLDFVESVNSFDDENDATQQNASCHPEQSVPCHPQLDWGSSISPPLPHSWLTILNEGESYGPSWDKAYERMTAKQSLNASQSAQCHPQLDWGSYISFSDEEGARIVAYMIFRYYAKSLFDGDSLTKVQFAIYFWLVLQKFANELSEGSSNLSNVPLPLSKKINAIKLLSKQTEYSDEIMEILADNFYQNPEFSIDKFRSVLSR